MLRQKLNLKLPAKNSLFIEKLIRNAYDVEVTGSSFGTLRILRDGIKCGYMNRTIIGRGNIIGLHLGKFGGSDASPDNIKHQIKLILADAIKCEPSSLDIHDGTGSNIGRRFVGINNSNIAWEALECAGK